MQVSYSNENPLPFKHVGKVMEAVKKNVTEWLYVLSQFLVIYLSIWHEFS